MFVEIEQKFKDYKITCKGIIYRLVKYQNKIVFNIG